MNHAHDRCFPPFNPSANPKIFPWERCAASKLVERYCDLVRAVSAEIPRGEFRLRDDLKRSASRLRRHVGLAAGEPEGSRFLALIQDALRDLHDTSLWVWECLKQEIGPPDAARDAWSLLERISNWLHSLHGPKLEPHAAPLAVAPRTRAQKPSPTRAQKPSPTLSSAAYEEEVSGDARWTHDGGDIDREDDPCKLSGGTRLQRDRGGRRREMPELDPLSSTSRSLAAPSGAAWPNAEQSTSARSLRAAAHPKGESFPRTIQSPQATSPARREETRWGRNHSLSSPRCRPLEATAERSSNWQHDYFDDDPSSRARNSAPMR